MSINWWVDKQKAIYPYNGLLFDHRKEQSTDTWRDLENIRQSERSWSQRPQIAWFCSYELPHPEEANLQRQKVTQRLPGPWRGEFGWAGEEWEVAVKMWSFSGWWKGPKMNFYVCIMLNILITMRLCTVKKSVLWSKVHIKQTTNSLRFFLRFEQVY